MKSTPYFYDEDLIAAIKEHPDYTSAQLAKLFGVTDNAIRKRKIKLKKHGWLEPKQISEIPEGYKLAGTSAYYNTEGKLRGHWVKTEEDKKKNLEIIKKLLTEFISELPKFNPIQYTSDDYDNYEYSNLLSVYPWGDPHIGMLALKEETGNEWNLNKAFEVHTKILDRLLNNSPPSETAILLNLGDLMHIDNKAGLTPTHGNILDKDGHYFQAARIAIKTVRYMIDACLIKHKKVIFEILPGNHDPIGSIWLGLALKHIYELEPRVEINDSPNVFHYYTFGENLIGMHHGHTCKIDQLDRVMSADKAKEWGETKFRYWLTGHIHEKTLRNFGACQVESFRTLAARDNYTHSSGYRSGRDLECLVFHNKYGLWERYTIPYLTLEEANKK